MVGGHAARAQREHREARVPHGRLARLGTQPVAVLDHEALPALDRLARASGRRGRGRARSSAMIPHTHGGWMPPHEPSASCRSRIHCSAVRCALAAQRIRPRAGTRPAAASRRSRDRSTSASRTGRSDCASDERDERLARPAREVVDRERRPRRQQHELGRDRHHPLPRPLAEQREEALREEAALRDAALALDVRERLRARVDAAHAQRDVRLDRRREVGRALEPDRPRAVVAHARHQLVRDAAVERRACAARAT